MTPFEWSPRHLQRGNVRGAVERRYHGKYYFSLATNFSFCFFVAVKISPAAKHRSDYTPLTSTPSHTCFVSHFHAVLEVPYLF